MISLHPSRDPDGMYEMDEMEELLKEEGEEFDKDSGSDGSEDVIFQQPSHHLSFKQKRFLQSLPPGSLVGQIAHRLEKEGAPLPFYLFWPWPKIRATLKALVWLGWLAIIVAAFWPIIQMYLFPIYCHERLQSKAWWLEGPLLRVDLTPNSSLSLLEENFNLIEEIDVKIIHLSSPSWIMNIHRKPKLSTAELEEAELTALKEICSFCHSHKMKVVMSINVVEVMQQLKVCIKFWLVLLLGLNPVNSNLNFLGLVLPGIPVLERGHLEQLRGNNSNSSLLRELLLVRKNAAALQEKDFSKLHNKGYLEQNVYAILRSYQEEKRYLVLWNLNNSTVVSLDFHTLSIRGQWAFRSNGPSDSSSFKMRNVKNLLTYELAVIELP
ncbi:hypothetical protein HOLleu_08302 [Holothuria leucospilota]|uniref:Uncharacterized protein n=1 Tax=Holothuria leucospilota TaxID=206669 RepID=A0A9Q1HGU9_HOLLE|nr:hypothetical protein HOLleu_08302 [Holothuria leucospilota]